MIASSQIACLDRASTSGLTSQSGKCLLPFNWAQTKEEVSLPLEVTSAALNEVLPSSVEKMVRNEGVSLRELRQTSFRRIRDGIGDAAVVLIGDSTHGTEEFYRIRAELTKVLIEHDGFDAVLCEGDFPPFFELNRYVGGARPHIGLPRSTFHEEIGFGSVDDAMQGFTERFPVWMWMNNVVKDFAMWLQAFNDSRRAKHEEKKLPVQLLGLDIYSLFRSIDEVTTYLNESGETELATVAKHRYETLNNFRPEPREYANALRNNTVSSQEKNVNILLTALHRLERRLGYIPGDGYELFSALQNARVVAAAESYHRKSIMGGETEWNIRESAFLGMVDETVSFLAKKKKEQGDKTKPRVIVWAHNSHVGDSDATEYKVRGQHSIGQLCRKAMGKDNVFILGFSTHEGTVRAAREWGGHDAIMKLDPSFDGSAEQILHCLSRLRHQNVFGYLLRANDRMRSVSVDKTARQILGSDLLQRFVGVTYIRSNELRVHYSTGRLSDQYDFIIHVDRSSALCVDRKRYVKNKRAL